MSEDVHAPPKLAYEGLRVAKGNCPLGRMADVGEHGVALDGVVAQTGNPRRGRGGRGIPKQPDVAPVEKRHPPTIGMNIGVPAMPRELGQRQLNIDRFGCAQGEKFAHG